MIDVKKVVLAALVLAYGLTRLYGLHNLPIFVDEALHIRRSVEGLYAEAFSVGKVFQVLMLRPFVSLPVDLLLLSRLLAVVAGLVTMLAIIWIGSRLFSDRTGLVSGIVYLVLPYTLFFNRLDVADSFEFAFAAIVVACSIRLAYDPGQRAAVAVLALALIAAILTKLSGVILVAIPPLIVIGLCSRRELRRPMRVIFPAMLLAGLLSIALLASGFGSEEIAWRGATNLSNLASNFRTTYRWYWILLTPGGCLLLIVSAVRHDRRVWMLAALFLIIPAAYMVTGRVIYSRYVLASLIPACVLIGHFLTRWLVDGQRKVEIAAAGLMIGVALTLVVPIDRVMILRPVQAALPSYDRVQYVSGYSSGYGIAETADFLNRTLTPSSAPKQVYIIEAHPNPEAALWYFLRGRTDIHLISATRDDLDTLAGQPDIWLIVDQSYRPVEPANKTRVWQFIRPGASEGLEIWH